MAEQLGGYFRETFEGLRRGLADGLRVMRRKGPSEVQFWFIALLIGVALQTKRSNVRILYTPLETVILIGILQATVGYVQYFNDIPALLVGIHVFGATMFFLSLVNLWLMANQIASANDVTTDLNSATVS